MKRLILLATAALLFVAGCAGGVVQYDGNTKENKKSEVETGMEGQSELLEGALECAPEDALYVAEQFTALELGEIVFAETDEDTRSFWKCVAVEVDGGGRYTLCLDKGFSLAAVRKGDEYVYRTLQ